MALVGLFMIYASVERLIHPLAISYTSALVVAILGLVVNVVCALILQAGDHEHEHDHSGHAHRHGEDLNLKAAYLHVVADAVTSILAIAALLGAKVFGIVWLDPAIGLLGAALILRWSAYLLKDTAKILLQREMDSPIAKSIRKLIESDGDSKIADLHLWQIAQNQYACIVSLVTGKTIDRRIQTKAFRHRRTFACNRGNLYMRGMQAGQSVLLLRKFHSSSRWCWIFLVNGQRQESSQAQRRRGLPSRLPVPYLGSPMTGWPMAARCLQIWCSRPVSISTSKTAVFVSG